MATVRAVSAAALASLLLAALPAAAQEPTAPAGAWHEARTERFSLFGALPEEELAAAAADLERMRDVLAQLAPGSDLDAPVPTYLYLFPDDASFEPYRLAGSSGADAGYLIPGPEANYAASTGAHPTRQVYKQYVLELLHRQLRGIPLWLRQGLAEYYSTFEADATEARIGLPLTMHLEWLGLVQADTLPLADLFALEAPPDERGPLASSAFYGQSWLVVHRLMSGDTAQRRRIGDYIRRTRSGEDPVAAFRAVFGIDDLEAFRESLEEYRKGDTFTFLRVPVASRRDYPVTVRPLGEAETAFRQGDLLLQLGASRRAAAEARLRRAVELDPELGPAWAALGRLAGVAGDEAAALERHERAAALAPDDFRVQLRYGQARLGSLGGRRAADGAGAAALEQAAAAFRRATELRPRSGEAWAGLGQAGVLAAEPDPAAVEALEKAVELLPPGRTDVLFNLLLARARVGDGEGAARAVDALRGAGADEALLSRAREIELQLDLQEAHRLATAGELDDAVALLARVRAESTQPAVAGQATTLLEHVARAEEHNRFAERYTEAVELFRAGDLVAAAAVVDAMRAEARPGRQVETLRDLQERIDAEAGDGGTDF